MAKYTIHVDDTQLNVIQQACELFARMNRGQLSQGIGAFVSDVKLTDEQVRELSQLLSKAEEVIVEQSAEPTVIPDPPFVSKVAWDLHQVLNQWQVAMANPDLPVDKLPQVEATSDIPLAVVVQKGVRI